MTHADKFRFVCTTCGREFKPAPDLYLCPDCAQDIPGQPPRGILKVEYHYERVPDDLSTLFRTGFLDLLPILNQKSRSPLLAGHTPLLRVNQPSGGRIKHDLFIKDDSRNPTFSFKDRASDIVSAYAKEKKIKRIVAASTGNAGSSLAGICASQNQEAVILAPAGAPPAKLAQIVHYGARLVPVQGSYDDAFALSLEATRRFSWYNRNTAFNPLTVEGKKTVAFELVTQLGGAIPDFVFVPVGDAVILTGVFKGFEELLRIGVIDEFPVIVAVQAVGSSNFVRNLGNDEFCATPATTRADSISVNVPANFHWAAQYMHEWEAEWITVSDASILDASKLLGRAYGVFAEPAAAAAMAGYLAYHRENRIWEDAVVVVLNTGCGLKDVPFVQTALPEAIPPTPEALVDFLK
jgi:threonine synthase